MSTTTMEFTGRPARLLIVPALLAASALCVALALFRAEHTGSPYFLFLIWNLMLAWVPLALAVGAFAASARGRPVVVATLGLLWLLFLPNAPYLLSDFVHLRPRANVPLGFDGLLLSSFAWTGLMLGFASLYLMHLLWRRAVGPKLSWFAVIAALSATSVGVYLGRFVRLNSWDAIVRPDRVAESIVAQAGALRHPWMLACLVALSAALTIGFAILYGIAGARLEGTRE